MKNLNSIREEWLQMFVKNGYHSIEPSSLIPKDDASLLWVNSGVAALKKYFNDPQTAPAKNLVNCQRVIRTNDIERIDSSSYHQTLFEMLGCFSIGGNFKTEVIPLIWSFFVSADYLAIDPRSLFITVLESDYETRQIWARQPGIFEKNIILGSRKTNFWDMGDGPCGPNTEIYYSFRKKDEALPSSIEELDGKDFIELINIVFSEFYHRKDDYLPLSEKCVDVGGGLERMGIVLQGVTNTFQTDIWVGSVNLLKECCIKKNTFADAEEWRIYVILDHLRTSIFAIADGALSGHKRHGYVLKKLIKRSGLFAHLLEIDREDLLSVSRKMINDNSTFYPFLKKDEDRILNHLDDELMKFMRSFEVSDKSIKRYLKAFSSEEIPAEKIFFWYDTEGIPIEIIKLSLLKEKRIFDQEAFNAFLNKQKQRSLSQRAKVSVFDY